MTIVIDASLAVKWLIQESDSDLAERFFVSHFTGMQAPDLLLVEVCGRLVKGANERSATRAQALAGLAAFQSRVDTAIVVHPVTAELAIESARLAIQLGHPIKDCVYLALADRLGCPLATCDVRFRDRVADPARVRLLAELV